MADRVQDHAADSTSACGTRLSQGTSDRAGLILSETFRPAVDLKSPEAIDSVGGALAPILSGLAVYDLHRRVATTRWPDRRRSLIDPRPHMLAKVPDRAADCQSLKRRG